MADNVPITAGSGTNIATEDVGGVHFQKFWRDHSTYQATVIAAGSTSIGVADGTSEIVGPTVTMPAADVGLGDRVGVWAYNPSLQIVDLRFKHQVPDPVGSKSVTGVAATDLFTSTTHGYSAGDKVEFSALTGGAGITAGQVYYVIASGLTANDFKVSATAGGSTIDFTTDVSAGTVQRYYFAPLGSAAGEMVASIPITFSEPDGVLLWFDGGLLTEGAQFTFAPVAALDATYSMKLVAWIRN